MHPSTQVLEVCEYVLFNAQSREIIARSTYETWITTIHIEPDAVIQSIQSPDSQSGFT